MKYVQSFYQYPVHYSSIGKGIPSKDADGELRNIAALEDSELDTLQRCEPMFRSLVNIKKYRILNKLPDSYKPSATLLNEAEEENARLRAELAAMQAKQDAAAASASGAANLIPDAGEDGSDATPPEPPASGDARPDLSKMDYKELQEYAAMRGVEKVTNVKKADLIKAIEDVEAAGAAH